MALKENEHYYIDKSGLLVFTEKYHLERGYCCKNRCRHCPYGNSNDATVKLKDKSGGTNWNEKERS